VVKFGCDFRANEVGEWQYPWFEATPELQNMMDRIPKVRLEVEVRLEIQP
jgi:hypothetical protein